MEKLVHNEKTEYRRNLPVCCKLYTVGHYPAHYHAYSIELVLCLKGEAEIQSCYEHRTLKPGDIFSMDPMDIHCIYSDEEAVLLSILIDTQNSIYSDNFLKGCFIACETVEINEITKKAMYEIQDIILGLAYTIFMEELTEGVCEVIKKRMDYMMTLLIQNFDWLSFVPDPYYTNRNFRERLDTIMSYCHDNYKEKITVSQLAKMVNINENYFSTFMRKTSFGGFRNCLNFIRCFRAEFLMLATERDIIEISAECGFSDPKYFYANFKKWWKKTPAKHRKWYREYAKKPEVYRLYSNEEAVAMLNEFAPLYNIRKGQTLA